MYGFSELILVICVIQGFLIITVTGCGLPKDVKAELKNGHIEVSWKPPQTGPEVRQYFLYVQRQLVTLSGGTLMYVALDPVLGTNYMFTVASRCTDGGTSTTAKTEFVYIGDPVFIQEGQSATITWNLSPNATSRDIDVKFSEGNKSVFTLSGTYIDYPEYKYRVIYNGDRSNGLISFELRNIVKGDAGYYMSIQGSDNKNIGGRVLVVLDKPSTPQLSSDSQIVGKPLAITCTSSSNSKPDYYRPQADLNYTWYINNAVQQSGKQGRYDVNGGTLIIDNVTKADRELTVSCEASDRNLVSDRENFKLNPLYGPEVITLYPPERTYTKKVGDRLGPINCSADCNPPCGMEWKWRPNKNIHNGNRQVSRTGILSLPYVRKQDEGYYRCIASAGNQEVAVKKNVIDISLDVQFQAEIKNITVLTNGGQERLVGEPLNLSENDDAILKCSTDADPPPTISWERNGVTLLSKSSVMSLEYGITSVSCNQTGSFTCKAGNGIGSEVSRAINLRVRCSPRRNTNFPADLRKGSQLNATVLLNVSVIAFPKPEGTWNTTKSAILTPNLPSDYNLFTFIYSATVKIKRREDFGMYYLFLSNRVGTPSKISFNITAEDKPMAPTNFTVEEAYTNRINLTWISSFNGGRQQTFYLNYSIKGESSWKNVSVSDDGFGKEIRSSISELQAETEYTFILFSRNDLGRTNSITLDAQTEAHPIVNTQSGNVGTIAAGVVVAILIVVIIIVGGILFYRRRQNPKQTKKDTGPRVDVVYAAVDKSDKKENNYKDDAVIYENAEGHSNGVTDTEKLYENHGDHSKTKDSANGRTVNEDGLIYLDVDVSTKPKKKGKAVIHGDEDRTEYMSIDFTKKADPLPDDVGT